LDKSGALAGRSRQLAVDGDRLKWESTAALDTGRIVPWPPELTLLDDQLPLTEIWQLVCIRFVRPPLRLPPRMPD
jgi:hypothetical protein